MQPQPMQDRIRPEGELPVPPDPSQPWPVDTPGGRYYAEFDYAAPMPREGQLIFFAQFLHTGGRWQSFLESAPLRYEGNRGSKVVDVLGTVVLSVLCGHWRYAHINSVRGDKLNPPLLGMTGTVSEDVVRGAMKRMDVRTGLAWLAEELRGCVEAVLSVPWILGTSTARSSRSTASAGSRNRLQSAQAWPSQPLLP